MSHLLITGFKGCGKTTIGRILAERLGREFVDLDGVIEDLYAGQHGERLSFREVYRKVGAGAFRRLEVEAARHVRRLAAEAPGALVIALGGGSLMTGEGRGVLRAIGKLVYLKVPVEELLRRVREGGYPAFITGDDPEKEFVEVLRQREPVYEQNADLVVDVGRADPAQAAQRVLAALGEEL